MRNTDVSITICILGPVATESFMTALGRWRPQSLSDIASVLASPSETALNIIKAGAQRWNTLSYPRMVTFFYTDLYYFMPETMTSLVRASYK